MLVVRYWIIGYQFAQTLYTCMVSVLVYVFAFVYVVKSLKNNMYYVLVFGLIYYNVKKLFLYNLI